MLLSTDIFAGALRAVRLLRGSSLENVSSLSLLSVVITGLMNRFNRRLFSHLGFGLYAPLATGTSLVAVGGKTRQVLLAARLAARQSRRSICLA